MGFGIKVEAPKVEAPKLAVPAVPAAPDLAGAAGGIAAGVKAAVTGAVGGAVGLAAGAKGGVGGALAAAAKGSLSLSAVAGVLAEVAVSFDGPSVDIAMEPHAVLDANASYGETEFRKGNLLVRVDMDPEEAKTCGDTLRLFSRSGEFDESRPVSAGVASGAATVDVEFTDAPMSDFFSLEIIPAGGKGYLLFVSVPYGDVGKRH